MSYNITITVLPGIINSISEPPFTKNKIKYCILTTVLQRIFDDEFYIKLAKNKSEK